MELWNQILFFLAGLGVFNGFLLALYFLLFAKPKKWANILFGLLMLMLCLRIGKSLFLIFADVPRLYKQIGLSACMMIGPFLFLYLRNLLSISKRPVKSDLLHTLFPLAAIVILGIIRPYETYPVLWNTVVVQGIYIVWIAYMIASFLLVWPLYRKTMNQSASILEQWMVLLNSSILILCIAFNLALHGFPYLAGPLLFSLVLYLLMAFLAAKRNRSIVLLEETIKYQNQKIETQEAELILRHLAEQMQLTRPYLQQNIKLAEVAASIDSTPHELSQVINDRLGISFNQYINEYRVKAACIMLQESDHLTVEGIGQEVGFKSRSAFYTAFKTFMDETPGQYKAKLKSTGV
jgi:AraC-like DNA-binding protein